MFNRLEHRHEDHDDEKLSSPRPRVESPDSVAERTMPDFSTTTTGPRPVPRHLLEPLRTYPRLRDVVFAYLLIQDRMDRYEDLMSELDAAGETTDRQFWTKLHGQLRGEGLRADFPSSLLEDQDFEDLVNRLDTEHLSARSAAAAGRNPHQSSESAQVAYDAVGRILELAETLSTACKAEARKLLDHLNNTVNKIFADESDPWEPDIGATERSTDFGLEASRLAPTVRDIYGKQQQGMNGPDVGGPVDSRRTGA